MYLQSNDSEGSDSINAMNKCLSWKYTESLCQTLKIQDMGDKIIQ